MEIDSIIFNNTHYIYTLILLSSKYLKIIKLMFRISFK